MIIYFCALRCRRHGLDRLDEVTLLTWAELDPSKDSKEITLHIEPTPILGYITDVKAIESQNRIYLVLGIGYNADLGKFLHPHPNYYLFFYFCN